MPRVVHTCSPIGQSFMLREWRTSDYPSGLRATSPEGKLYFHGQGGTMKPADGLACLEQLPGEVPGHMVVIWDGAPMQGGHVIKASWQIGRPNGCIWNAYRPMP